MKRSSILSSFLAPLIGAGVLLSLAGCATQGPTPSALCSLTDDNGNPIPATFTGTLNPRHQGHAASHVVLVQKAETACCAGFDRIVFTCEGFHHPTWRSATFILQFSSVLLETVSPSAEMHFCKFPWTRRRPTLKQVNQPSPIAIAT